MKKIIFATLVLCFAIACKKEKKSGTNNVTEPVDNETLKSTASFTTGVAISYDLMNNNTGYANVVKKEFDRVTFEWQMKHGANVQNNGNFDFTRSDELFNICNTAGLEVYGHTLVWHANNNANYLKSLTSGSGANLISNAGFENDFTNWFSQVSTTAPTNATIAVVNTGAQSGSKAVRVNVLTPGPNAYSVQLVSDNITLTNNTTYTLKFWAKAATAGQSLRIVAQGTNSYYEQLNQSLTTNWAEYSFPFTPTENTVGVKFHFPNAGDFMLDNLSLFTPGNTINPTLVNSAMQNWIAAMVGRYATKVKAWDVVNEAFEENGSLRISGTAESDKFYWGGVLGRSYIANAFRYANNADPAALLFMNDYNLEYSNQKLDSFVAMANELKMQNVPIHGVATQMHINYNISNAIIDNMLTKLASTGLKVHISELDIRINPNNIQGFTPTPELLQQQAEKYKYIAQAYARIVPASQRYGITVWNVTDADSWIVTSLNRVDFPCLFNANYSKKVAYTYFRQGLQ